MANGGIVLKRRFFCCVLLIAIAGMMAARAAAKAGETPVADYVRLHVLAEDDSEPAQALKLRVRDSVLAAARRLLSDCKDAKAAWRIVNENLDTLESAAREQACREGFEGPVTAETGVFDFPDRRYGGVLVPAGKYRALRVVIGAGEGHNWWCVLYPSMCLTEECDPDEPVRFHSTILNWLCRLFGGDGA